MICFLKWLRGLMTMIKINVMIRNYNKHNLKKSTVKQKTN